ncbi:hypothetical protein [Nonomuraea ceibae]|uniref:hypothetical protein n=1 Tax=Nonomuraea ceibae TaxID=1935170 RepID=UPI001C5F051D|nr:hypothetical protein [Nonomuraea ceibae]
MDPAIAARIPLVCRTKPPGKPLPERIADLTALSIEPAGADHRDLVARACGVLNISALIASDAALPDLAATLCWRQHKVFAEAGDLPQDIAVMSLMPLINIARMLIREGDGKAAYEILDQLYRAAQRRGSTVICGHTVDLSPLTRSSDEHRAVCTELWVALLIDGARALAQQGRWSDAADAMAAHRGIGDRLLDGRQLKVMALVEQGHLDEATEMIDSTVPVEPWEATVASLLRIAVRSGITPTSGDELERVVGEVLSLLTSEEPTTAAFRVRLALTALDVAACHSSAASTCLATAIIDVASTDAYAARDVLGHPAMRSSITSRQHQNLTAVIAAAALGTGSIPDVHWNAITKEIDHAEARLRTLLAAAPLTSHESGEGVAAQLGRS